ncbi:hypothetical protein LG311_19650 [Sutcliffiella horikoshii]|uniref:hypothetical protein n=1 Tax=Sutcliffiella horikoshii TaxID=79883 RepID=UPI00384EDEE2
MISATFKVTPVLAMALASVIIYAAGMSSKVAIALLLATGVGGLIVASLMSIGLVALASKYGWSKTRLSFW